MPARVHAVVVVRPDGRTPAALHLRRTLTAIAALHRPVDALTIVLCGADEELERIARDATPTHIRTLSLNTGYAAAVAGAISDIDEDALWLLAQDTAPETDALTHLVSALELAPSLAFVAPKLTRWNDRSELVSMGATMTRFGRTVMHAEGQLDQGQHDGREDILGADIRAILVRTDAWRDLGGLDAALLGADQGLDLGVRARLASSRVSIVPRARVATAGDGVAGVPAPISPQRRQRAAYISRTAQLHRRLVYANPVAAVLLWLSMLPLAAWNTVLLLLRKQPELIGPEWWASLTALGRPLAILRSRRRLAEAKRVPWSQLAPLRVTGSQLREVFGTDEAGESPTVPTRRDLRFFTGGGAWLVLAALVTSVVAFPALLAWPVLGGGALQPLRTTVSRLWADASYGQLSLGWDVVAPADPFSTVVALIGSTTPWQPSQAIVVLWILALPLAALGGWFMATRVTERSVLRMTAGIAWALAPTFLIALVDGRPTAVIVHVLLPWLFVAASVAHRSWAGAGAASLILVAVIAASPSLAPAVVALWVMMLLLVVAMRGGRGASRLVWMLVPTAVFFAPLIWHAIATGDGWVLLADPGVAWAGPQVAADATGRSLLAAGIPTPDIAGWATLLPEGSVWWVPLLVVPLALLALAAPLSQRWASGIALLVVAAVGLGTAFAAVGIAVVFDESEVVALWPGAALSLAWLGVLGGALVTLDAALAPRLRAARAAGAVVVSLAIIVLALPSLTAMARGTAYLDRGDASTLPAYIAAEGRDDANVGTLVLTPQSGGGLAAQYVWGGSETLGGQSTVIATQTTATEQDELTGTLAADLVTSTDSAAIEELAAQGISFVLLAVDDGDETPAARALRLSATTSLNQRDTLEGVGETAKGELWRVVADVSERAAPSEETQTMTTIVAISQLAVVGIAVLLAIPTAATRRAARRTPRVVGPYWQEGR
ncbi:glycosyltransferase [Microbacterium marmarense]|uniref:Glycosyltransferase n=1 Tax=Microbacterium marmarense TaxID=3122051 RepID=A0ABU8LX74_9MICO